MKRIFAWLPSTARPTGKGLLCGMCIDSVAPAGVDEHEYCSFTVSKGDSMDFIKQHLQRKREMLKEAETRLKEKAWIRIIGADKTLLRARFAPEKQTGCNWTHLA